MSTTTYAAQTPTTSTGDVGLDGRLRAAVDARHYADVLDTRPLGSAAVGRSQDEGDPDSSTLAKISEIFRAQSTAATRRIHQTPNVDVAMIELNPRGDARAAADVLLSPKYPHGVTVPLGNNMSTKNVRWRVWDDDTWDATGLGKGDVLPGRESARFDFASPYPASMLKLMVGFGVLRLADESRLRLDDIYKYEPGPDDPSYHTCGHANITKTIRQFFDEMITKSQNESTCALIKKMHDLRAVDKLNNTFAELGLTTLMLIGTKPETGGHWGKSNMSALDTAKLLLLVNGGDGVLWRTPIGAPVTKAALSDSSRQFFLHTLADQGHNDLLSTTNYCGRAYPAAGIPQLTTSRWINSRDGTVTVGDDKTYGRDVRPCNATAEVTFAHKTGWVDTGRNDAGIVHSLPGKPKRDYIVVMFSNLGMRYIDVNRPPDPPGVYEVLSTQKHAELGRAIDGIETSRAG